MATRRNEPTGWVGWVYFASFMMLLAGSLHLVAGLVALFKEDFYVVTERALLAFNYTTWGWAHLAIGVVLLTAGISALAGGAWGRIIGSFVAILSIVANMAFISTYPFWSILIIVVDVLIIYGLIVHGDEAKG